MHAKWLYKCKWVFTIDHALHLSKGHNIPEHKVECVLIKFFELCEVKFITYLRICNDLALPSPPNFPVILVKA